MNVCETCKIELAPKSRTLKQKRFCSQTCQAAQRYKESVAKWQRGELTGLNTNGVVTPFVKRYLREKYGNRCTSCGWSRINLHTGKVPLVADHIDGNWQNNDEDNLTLICHNCDSLQKTFGGANRGKGRRHRK